MHANGMTHYCALLFGHYPLLLETRRRLLEIDGCTGEVALTMQAYRSCLQARSFNLVILCQSSSASERAEAVAIAAQYRPDARVLLLYSSYRWDNEDGRNSVLVDSMAGPAGFLQVVHQLVPTLPNLATATSLRPTERLAPEPLLR